MSPRDNADETRWMTAGGVNETEISLVVPAVDGGRVEEIGVTQGRRYKLSLAIKSVNNV